MRTALCGVGTDPSASSTERWGRRAIQQWQCLLWRQVQEQFQPPEVTRMERIVHFRSSTKASNTRIAFPPTTLSCGVPQRQTMLRTKSGVTALELLGQPLPRRPCPACRQLGRPPRPPPYLNTHTSTMLQQRCSSYWCVHSLSAATQHSAIGLFICVF